MTLAAIVLLGPLVTTALILVARRWAAALALAGVGVSLLAAVVTLGRVVDGARFAATLPGLPGLPLRLAVDPLGALLAATVATVAALVLVYAIGYLGDEPDRVRFFAAMAFFVAAMQTLVLAGDWLLFLAAWELIALASYLLIGFWFERPRVATAATRAFLTTRAADLGLYVGIFVLVAAAGTSEIAASRNVGGWAATVAGLAFLLAATGKSAQAPLHGWLQDAMAGPTPVSALLHSATLVVAGVVLLIRASPLLSDEARLAIGLVGGGSALVTGVVALAQRDLKRLLAASTASQLGLMLLALGAGAPVAAVVHLVTNAGMKSALFLGAGVFQHARDSTAFADLAGVGRGRRAAFAAVALAGLALAGVPPLAGFWSKDAVIAATLHAPNRALLAPLALAATALTGAYVARALRLLWGRSGDRRRGEGGEADAGAGWMGAGLAGLAVPAAVLGLAVAPIGRLLGTEVPEDAVGVALGLGAAAVGLLAGWLVPTGRLLGPLSAAALDGFRVADGWDGLAVRPALAMARGGDRLDRGLHGAVLGTGRRVLAVAATGRRVDAGVHALVGAAGGSAFALARASRRLDEVGIDGLIRDLVAETRRLGLRARGLQTGLIHRELLLAAGGVAIVLILVLAA